MKAPVQTPFDSVENAQRYVRLLVEAIAEAKQEIATDIGAAEQSRSERRMQALQVVQVKLDQLERHLQTSSRLLNDLRTLRRLLLDERIEPSALDDSEADPAGEDPAA
jgi:formiminotetrahydrofolate cyclodeaminase